MSDTASVVAGAIPVVGSVIQGLLNNSNTDSNNQANRDFQLQQQNSQNAYNTAQIQRQEEYNSPVEQMARLKAAGLNPNMVYGNAGSVTGNVAMVPPPSAEARFVSQPRQAPDLGNAAASGVAAYNNTRLGTAQTNNLAAQTVNTGEDTFLKQFQEFVGLMQALKTGAEIPTIQPTADANINNLNSSAFKSKTEANVASYLAPFQADLASANTAKAMADANFVIDDNVRQAATTSQSLKESVARIAKMAVDNAKTDAERSQINANTQVLLNSKTLGDMDVSMRLNGIMPHDSAPLRALQTIYNHMKDPVDLSNFVPNHQNPIDYLKQHIGKPNN